MIDRRIGKNKIRRGTDLQRQSIVFAEGEMLYTTDKKRVFIGDGVTTGGIQVSNRNYIVTVTDIPINALSGDIIHNKVEGKTYILDYDINTHSLKKVLIADNNYVEVLQAEIDDLYSRLRSLTGCLDVVYERENNFKWVIHPSPVNLNLNQTGTLTVSAISTDALTYQWRRLDTGTLTGAIQRSYVIGSAKLSDMADYVCVATSTKYGSITSNPASVIIDGNSILSDTDEYYITDENGNYIVWEKSVDVAPFITQQPISQETITLNPKSFTIEADGTLPLYYQWRINGFDVPNENGTKFTISRPTKSINITCVVYNSVGYVVSNIAGLTVYTLPSILVHPISSQTVDEGSSVSFKVVADGTPPFYYEWRRNGSAILNATQDTYTINSVKNTDAASYTCYVTNIAGAIESNAAELKLFEKPKFYNYYASVGTLGEQSGTLSINLTVDDNFMGNYKFAFIGGGNTYFNCRGGSYSCSFNTTVFYEDGSRQNLSNNGAYSYRMFLKKSDGLYFQNDTANSTLLSYNGVFSSGYGTYQLNDSFINYGLFRKVKYVVINDSVTQSKGGPCYGGMSSINGIIRYL